MELLLRGPALTKARARATTNPALLQRLSKRLQGVAPKLGDLVQEQHPEVGWG